MIIPMAFDCDVVTENVCDCDYDDNEKDEDDDDDDDDDDRAVTGTDYVTFIS